MRWVALISIAFLATACVPVLEAQVAPMPQAWPAVDPLTLDVPSISLAPAGVVPVPLPGLHERVGARLDGHADAKHGTDAAYARRIIEDPKSDCRFMTCNGYHGVGASVLRVCFEAGTSVAALQFIWPDVQGRWHEGTAFIQTRSDKLGRWLDNRGCKQAGPVVTVPAYDVAATWALPTPIPGRELR